MTNTNKTMLAATAVISGIGGALYLNNMPSATIAPSIALPTTLPAGADPYSPIPFRAGTVGSSSYHYPFCPYAKQSLAKYGVGKRINYDNVEQLAAAKRTPCPFCKANVTEGLPIRSGTDGSNLYHKSDCKSVLASWAKYGIAKRIDFFDWPQIKASKRLPDQAVCHSDMVTISGRVVDKDGKGVPGVTITATPSP